MEHFRDVHWIAMFAIRPFLGSEDEPAPELPTNPLDLEYGGNSDEDRFEREVERVLPVGASMVDGRKVYSLDGGDGTWLFKRDPSEFEE